MIHTNLPIEKNFQILQLAFIMKKPKKISIFKNFLLNTSFHGYKFIVEEGRHWTERLFWLICVTSSWIAASLLILSAYDDFLHNAISFVVDTNFLDWDTNFPSIVICETNNDENIANVTDRIFGDPHDYNLDEYVKELVFYKGLNLNTLQVCGPQLGDSRDKNCFIKNFSFYQHVVKSSCSDIFRVCQWKSVSFDCCAYFREIDTELGKCFALNSMQVRENNPTFYNMISNKETGPGKFALEINGMVNLYTLGPLEIPSLSTLATDIIELAPHVHFKRFFAIKEIHNQPEVRYVSVEQRKCRFPNENDLDVFPHYSYSACCVQCRKRAQLEKCGCIHHLMPNTAPKLHCNLDGIDCLNRHYSEISIFKASWSKRKGLVCGCLPSCNEIELALIRDDKRGMDEDFAMVELILERLPTERFQRNVVRGKLDLVVSMGGAAALFLGASLLSFIEMIHFFIVTPLSDFVRNKRKKRKVTWKPRKFSALPTIY